MKLKNKLKKNNSQSKNKIRKMRMRLKSLKKFMMTSKEQKVKEKQEEINK